MTHIRDVFAFIFQISECNSTKLKAEPDRKTNRTRQKNKQKMLHTMTVQSEEFNLKDVFMKNITKFHQYQIYVTKSKSMTDMNKSYVNEPLVKLKINRRHSFDHSSIRLKNEFEKFKGSSSSNRKSSCNETINECEATEEEYNEDKKVKMKQLKENIYVRKVLNSAYRRSSLPTVIMPPIVEPNEENVSSDLTTSSVSQELDHPIKFNSPYQSSRQRRIGRVEELEKDLDDNTTQFHNSLLSEPLSKKSISRSSLIISIKFLFILLIFLSVSFAILNRI